MNTTHQINIQRSSFFLGLLCIACVASLDWDSLPRKVGFPCQRLNSCKLKIKRELYTQTNRISKWYMYLTIFVLRLGL